MVIKRVNSIITDYSPFLSSLLLLSNYHPVSSPVRFRRDQFFFEVGFKLSIICRSAFNVRWRYINARFTTHDGARGMDWRESCAGRTWDLDPSSRRVTSDERSLCPPSALMAKWSPRARQDISHRWTGSTQSSDSNPSEGKWSLPPAREVRRLDGDRELKARRPSRKCHLLLKHLYAPAAMRHYCNIPVCQITSKPPRV